MEKLVEEILENFDFERVKKVMDLLDWKYGDFDETPSLFKLIKTAEERLEYSYKRAMERKEDCTTSCGGFQAFAGYTEEKETVSYLELQFVLSSWSEQVDDE